MKTKESKGEIKMTVLDYVLQNEIQEFYCKTSTEIILIHTHRSRTNKETKISEVFGRENLCRLKDWNKYKSFHSFANKEIVKIDKDFRGMLIFYVRFSNTDWQKEIKDIQINSKEVSLTFWNGSKIEAIVSNQDARGYK